MGGALGIEVCPAGITPKSVVSWNVAAINNNPFEYWLTMENANYNNLMDNVAQAMKNPGEEFDITVAALFPETKVQELASAMKKLQWSGIEEAVQVFRENFSNRKIITGFMHDTELGAKRFMSMPDRISNTVDTADGKQIFRPTVINCYPGTFENHEDWWNKWMSYMFNDSFTVTLKGQMKTTNMASMLQPIKRAKYPAVSEFEEKISLPLQVISLAIFDAILLHVVDTIAKDSWQEIRHQVSEALNIRKNENLLRILSSEYYKDVDIFFLQEVAGAFVKRASAVEQLQSTFEMIVPQGAAGRDQNSVIFVRKSEFDVSSMQEVSGNVVLPQDSKVEIEPGDLLAVTIKDRAETPNTWLLASFHGDTNGLATIPVLKGVRDLMLLNSSVSELKPILLFGMDANVYEKAKPGKLVSIAEFSEFYRSLGLTSTWGSDPNPKNYTTFNARTFLQPQLNKATRKDEFLTKGDVNPKDFIIYDPLQLVSSDAFKDNTGKREYIEGMVFPTLQFPSDHGIIGAVLEGRRKE